MYGLWGYLLKAKALAPINAGRVLKGGWYLNCLRSRSTGERTWNPGLQVKASVQAIDTRAREFPRGRVFVIDTDEQFLTCSPLLQDRHELICKYLRVHILVQFIFSSKNNLKWCRDPHYYTRRVKEAIHVRLHSDDIDRDSGIEIPEAWMPTIRKKHNNRRAVRQRTTEGTNQRNSKDQNAPITTGENHPITAEHNTL